VTSRLSHDAAKTLWRLLYIHRSNKIRTSVAQLSLVPSLLHFNRQSATLQRNFPTNREQVEGSSVLCGSTEGCDSINEQTSPVARKYLRGTRMLCTGRKWGQWPQHVVHVAVTSFDSGLPAIRPVRPLPYLRGPLPAPDDHCVLLCSAMIVLVCNVVWTLRLWRHT